MYDILIRDGKIVDGAGNPWFRADLAIAGDKIVALGDLREREARLVIEAAGKIVCPGFVDAHSHSDLSIMANRPALSSLYQGVVTEIVGSCGLSVAPVSEISRPILRRQLRSPDPDPPADWTTMGDCLGRLAGRVGINIGMQVGHGSVRRAVMGNSARPPTEDDLRALERLTAESLDAGAIGLSFGLEYAPGSDAGAEELRRLCAVAAGRRKLTSWHVRNRDRRFESAIAEAIEVTHAAGAALQLSHLSAKPGSTPRAWNRVMEQVHLARAAGDDIQCDMIPFVAGPGLLSAILPEWAWRGSISEIQARLRDPATRRRLADDSDRYWLMFHYRQWDRVVLATSRAHPDWVGLSFREIGERAGQDPFEAVFDILADEGAGMEGVWITGFLFSEGDVMEWIADPLFSIASDGFTAQADEAWLKVANHPNSFGWTPAVIQKYVNETRTLRLEEAIHKMTGLPAARWGLTDRGFLLPGMAADVLVFDSARFKTRATYAQPHHYAEGMEQVIINGQLALRDGRPTGALAGRVLAH
jgi:N-acyl-D-aspartate/D-glutamate deacylase